MRTMLSTVLAAAALITAAPLQAQSVYNNGTPNGSAGWDIFNDFRAADDFRFTGALSFDLIRFWGLLPTGVSPSSVIFWDILQDGGSGTPSTTSAASGSVTAQTNLRTSLGELGFDSWQFDLLVGPQLLGPGIYWLALHDGPLGDITDSSLIWEMTSSNYLSQFGVDFIPAQEWSGSMGGDLAFDLRSTAVVPEPSTVILLGTGLAGLAALHHRRRKKDSDG